MAKQYRLGRNAVLIVDGVVLQSVQDAVVRVEMDEVDAHHGGDGAKATLVIRKTIQVQFSLLDVRESLYLGQRLEPAFGQSPRPRLALVTLLGGHVTRSFYATVNDLEEDQPLRGASGTRWLLRQWGKVPLQTLPGA